MEERGSTGRPVVTNVLVALVVLNLLGNAVSLIIEGPTPSAIVYSVLLVVGLWLLLRRERAGIWFLAGSALLFLVVHVPFVRAALSASCTNPVDAARPCQPALWIAWLGVIPVATVVTALLAGTKYRRAGDRP
jgi:hypothetical protein